MPAKRALAEPRDVVYLYDGGLAGFFNCVYESVYEHELPAAIVTEQDPQPSLMLQKRIAADPGRAVRVQLHPEEDFAACARAYGKCVFKLYGKKGNPYPALSPARL